MASRFMEAIVLAQIKKISIGVQGKTSLRLPSGSGGSIFVQN
jgi:hypothetical protein